eukprot:g4606.t1
MSTTPSTSSPTSIITMSTAKLINQRHKNNRPHHHQHHAYTCPKKLNCPQPKNNNITDINTNTTFDILSKWYIDGELEIKQNLHEHEKSELIEEIRQLEQKNHDIIKSKKLTEKKLIEYIHSLETKVGTLENDKRKLQTTIQNLEKSLLGENDWYEEEHALDNALITFTNGLKK